MIRTLHYLTYTWWRAMRWLRAKHSKANWKWFKERSWGKDKISAAGVVLITASHAENAEMLNA
ncbi:hypothetical protein ABZ468_24585 [Streptomyces sp. NPDC005708]|uniref:hypothetical protein n=1 Tax=Streptomyces sp. NPDC005708 TaxID=3154564 RepID=UPI0033C8FFED